MPADMVQTCQKNRNRRIKRQVYEAAPVNTSTRERSRKTWKDEMKKATEDRGRNLLELEDWKR